MNKKTLDTRVRQEANEYAADITEGLNKEERPIQRFLHIQSYEAGSYSPAKLEFIVRRAVELARTCIDRHMYDTDEILEAIRKELSDE